MSDSETGRGASPGPSGDVADLVATVLSEETKPADRDEAAGHGRVWIVDPLDGTREFGEPPRTDWAVHVALVVDGRPVLGAVALPGGRAMLAPWLPAFLQPEEAPAQKPAASAKKGA